MGSSKAQGGSKTPNGRTEMQKAGIWRYYSKTIREKTELYFLCSSKGKFRKGSEREQCGPSITAASNLERLLTHCSFISQFCNHHPPSTDRTPPLPYELYISFPFTNTRLVTTAKAERVGWRVGRCRPPPPGAQANVPRGFCLFDLQFPV